jgi:hypothetical protein
MTNLLPASASASNEKVLAWIITMLLLGLGMQYLVKFFAFILLKLYEFFVMNHPR